MKRVRVLAYFDPANLGEERPDEQFVDIRIEAANVISSLAHGSSEVLLALFKARAHEEVLFAVSTLRPEDPGTLKFALLRALTNLIIGAAEVVGPPLWGPKEVLQEDNSEARNTLDYFFKVSMRSAHSISF